MHDATNIFVAIQQNLPHIRKLVEYKC